VRQFFGFFTTESAESAETEKEGKGFRIRI